MITHLTHWRLSILSLGVSCVLFLGLDTAFASPPFSLKDAIGFAVEHSPVLDSARLSRNVGELQVKSAKAKFLPSLDLTSSHGLQKTYTPGALADPIGSQMNLSLTENLYDNGESFARYDISKVNREIASLGFLRAREQLSLDIGTQFFQLSQAQQLFEVKQKQVDILKKQLSQVTNHFHEGIQTRTDYLRLATQVKRADIDVRNAQLTIRQAELELRRLMGVGSTDNVTFQILTADKLPIPSPDDTPPVDKAFDYRIAKLQTELNPLNVKLVEQKYWPQLLVTSSANYANFGYLNSPNPYSTNQQYGWNVLLGINFNIFDWGIRRRDVEVAKAQALIQDNELKKTELQLTSDIKNLMLTISQLRATDQLAQELQQAEEETYRFIRNEYENGKVTYLDLITSLNNTLDAKIQYLTTHYGLATAWTKYHFFRTTLYETVSK